MAIFHFFKAVAIHHLNNF